MCLTIGGFAPVGGLPTGVWFHGMVGRTAWMVLYGYMPVNFTR